MPWALLPVLAAAHGSGVAEAVPDAGVLAAILSSAGTGTAIIVVLVLTGWLVTKSAHEQQAAGFEARITDIQKADDARADALSAERDRAIARAERAEQRAESAERQRDEILRAATEQTAPTMSRLADSFTSMLAFLGPTLARMELERRASDGGGQPPPFH